MIDERLKMHRLKSTSHAAMAGAALLGGLWYWQAYVDHVFRHDILFVLAAMAAVKLGSLLCYRLTD